MVRAGAGRSGSEKMALVWRVEALSRPAAQVADTYRVSLASYTNGPPFRGEGRSELPNTGVPRGRDRPEPGRLIRLRGSSRCVVDSTRATPLPPVRDSCGRRSTLTTLSRETRASVPVVDC